MVPPAPTTCHGGTAGVAAARGRVAAAAAAATAGKAAAPVATAAAPAVPAADRGLRRRDRRAGRAAFRGNFSECGKRRWQRRRNGANGTPAGGAGTTGAFTLTGAGTTWSNPNTGRPGGTRQPRPRRRRRRRWFRPAHDLFRCIHWQGQRRRRRRRWRRRPAPAARAAPPVAAPSASTRTARPSTSPVVRRSRPAAGRQRRQRRQRRRRQPRRRRRPGEHVAATRSAPAAPAAGAATAPAAGAAAAAPAGRASASSAPAARSMRSATPAFTTGAGGRAAPAAPAGRAARVAARHRACRRSRNYWPDGRQLAGGGRERPTGLDEDRSLLRRVIGSSASPPSRSRPLVLATARRRAPEKVGQPRPAWRSRSRAARSSSARKSSTPVGDEAITITGNVQPNGYILINPNDIVFPPTRSDRRAIRQHQRVLHAREHERHDQPVHRGDDVHVCDHGEPQRRWAPRWMPHRARPQPQHRDVGRSALQHHDRRGHGRRPNVRGPGFAGLWDLRGPGRQRRRCAVAVGQQLRGTHRELEPDRAQGGRGLVHGDAFHRRSAGARELRRLGELPRPPERDAHMGPRREREPRDQLGRHADDLDDLRRSRRSHREAAGHR